MAGLHGHGQRSQAVVVLCLMDGWGELDAFVPFKQRVTAHGCENLLLNCFVLLCLFTAQLCLCFSVDFVVLISVSRRLREIWRIHATS